MAGLLDTITGAIGSGTTDGLAKHLGESPENTSSAMSAAIPVILAAMVGKAQTDAGGVASLVTSALSRGNPLDHTAELADPPAPGVQPDDGGLASGLLGGSFGTIATTLAGKFGLKADSVRTLLGVAGLFSAGGIGRALGGNISAQGLTSLLDSERGSIQSALPAGMGSLLGLGSFGAGASRAAAGATESVRETAAAAGGGLGKWLPWLLLAVAAIALILLLRSCGNDTARTPDTTVAPTEVVDPGANTAMVAPAPVPTGSAVVGETRAGKPALIVYFDTAKSDVSKDLSGVAAALKTYLEANPTATLAVAGFNDPTGNAAANAALSKNRAEAVKAALVKDGFAADKIALVKPAEASGTGTTNAESRRVEVTVAQ